ncbi:MAG: ribonuclease III family protein, partial [Pontibacterium sp.]
RELSFGDYLRLGSGELKSGGYRRDSILADSVEAVIGAIYLDSDLETARGYILHWYAQRLANIDPKTSAKDSKTQLQEFLQSRRVALPVYDLYKVEGESHNQTFYISCQVKPLAEPTLGKGSSRRQAEQNAAKAALAKLKEAK